MKDWVMVRITKDTRARLREFSERQQRRASEGHLQLPELGRWGDGQIPVDWIINQVLDRDDAHRARAAKQQRKNGKQEVEEEMVVADTPIEVIPETPLERFRDMYANLANKGEADALDGAEYRRVKFVWDMCGQPDVNGDWIKKEILAGR